MLECNNIKKLKPLVGYDTQGTVYWNFSDEFVQRKVAKNYRKKIELLYQNYVDYRLDKIGLVETRIDKTSNLSEELVLQHRKILISYPYEWSLNGFKDALLFHLDLLLALDGYGLTLKDALPSNILFNYTNLVFVDFLSLVQNDDLNSEEWLASIGKGYPDLRKAVLDKMFIPYFLIPFLLVAKKEYVLAREMLLHRACNRGKQEPMYKDLMNNQGHLSKIKNVLAIVKQYISVKWASKKPFLAMCKQLRNIVASYDVTPPQSPYLSYYDEKKENFNFEQRADWQNKQKNVYKILSRNPSTVLDLGANSGWFSFLAAYCGAKVVAVDIDEACVDYIYRYAKKNKLKITPLKISFEELTHQYFGQIPQDLIYKDRDFKRDPLFLAPIDRLQSEVVLCLALLHHLVLGAGHSIEEVMKVLAALTLKTLVVEYVDWQDNVIVAEPSFFRSLISHLPQTYSLDVIIKEGLKYFSSYDVVDSSPNTRKLIIFSRE